MKLGQSNHKTLSAAQSRGLYVLLLVLGIIVVISTYSHLTYTKMRAVVVGNTIDLASQSEGRIAELPLQENESYRRGDLLVRIGNDALHIEAASLEHEIEEIQRSMALELSGQGLERRRYEVETDRAEAQRELESARAEIERVDHVLEGLRARRDAARLRLQTAQQLFAEGAMTTAEVESRRKAAVDSNLDYEEMVSRRRRYESEVAAQERIMALMDQRLANLDSDRSGLVSELEIELADRQSELSRLRALIDELQIVADHDGVVTAVRRKVGEWVASGQPILTVMTADDMWVEVYLPPAEKHNVQPGDRVEIRASEHGGTVLDGRVDRILPVLRQYPDGSTIMDTRTYAVMVVVLDDIERARSVLSPQQQVAARIRRGWGLFSGGDASARELHGRRASATSR
ncbi:MAG: HlyD family efflux transporter periplasmic adaptor subunit [Candidatus Eiseniibacteriota bacterium]|jgi:multidrug resistance efflux pump